ncbi:MAG: Sir2 family NAD-dependent protein deacetylase [Chloroflexota bacterium]
MRSGELRRAAQLIAGSSYAVALTGAGISTPSGIPDFRSPRSGLWAHYDPMEVASLYAFQRQPQAFYDWLRPLAEMAWRAHPNPAHLALAELEESGMLRGVITQNIDDLHQKAGSKTVLELHGNFREATCLRCYSLVPAASFLAGFLSDGQVPRCHCGAVLKPNVVLFGEMLPVGPFYRAQEMVERCDLMIVVGSSLEVAPAADLPGVALAHGAKLAIFNRGRTTYDSRATVLVKGDVSRTLPKVARLSQQLKVAMDQSAG